MAQCRSRGRRWSCDLPWLMQQAKSSRVMDKGIEHNNYGRVKKTRGTCQTIQSKTRPEKRSKTRANSPQKIPENTPPTKVLSSRKKNHLMQSGGVVAEDLRERDRGDPYDSPPRPLPPRADDDSLVRLRQRRIKRLVTPTTRPTIPGAHRDHEACKCFETRCTTSRESEGS